MDLPAAVCGAAVEFLSTLATPRDLGSLLWTLRYPVLGIPFSAVRTWHTEVIQVMAMRFPPSAPLVDLEKHFLFLEN